MYDSEFYRDLECLSLDEVEWAPLVAWDFETRDWIPVLSDDDYDAGIEEETRCAQ